VTKQVTTVFPLLIRRPARACSRAGSSRAYCTEPLPKFGEPRRAQRDTEGLPLAIPVGLWAGDTAQHLAIAAREATELDPDWRDGETGWGGQVGRRRCCALEFARHLQCQRSSRSQGPEREIIERKIRSSV